MWYHLHHCGPPITGVPPSLGSPHHWGPPITGVPPSLGSLLHHCGPSSITSAGRQSSCIPACRSPLVLQYPIVPHPVSHSALRCSSTTVAAAAAAVMEPCRGVMASGLLLFLSFFGAGLCNTRRPGDILDSEVSGVSVLLEHAFEFDDSVRYKKRGTLLWRPGRENSLTLSQMQLTEDERVKLRDMAGTDGLYRIRIPRKLGSESSTLDYVSSFVRVSMAQKAMGQVPGDAMNVDRCSRSVSVDAVGRVFVNLASSI
ncbi:uncharacterized protein LOC144591608, partial [Rhinoraja longicauda]